MIEAQESITGTISSPTAINSVINNGVVIPTETDPTVPAHVKAITEEQIANWENGSNIDLSNYYTKADVDQKGYITEEQVDNKGFITSVPEETDPTVPEYVKNITEEQISNWDKGGNTDLTNYYTKDEVDNKGYTTEEDIATYVEANKETLRGPQGIQGPKGDKGDKADTPEFEKETNGPTLTIEDGKKVKTFEIDGTSYQKTTSGKNICPTDVSNWVKGQYSTAGNIGIYENRIRVNVLIPCEPNTTYYSSCIKGYRLAIRTYKKDQTFNTSIGVVPFEGNFTTDVNSYYLGIFIYSELSTTDDLLVKLESDEIQPFICLNSETDKSFEPYTNGASPNPDYPQEVEVIEGSVDVEVIGKNLANINDNTNNVSSKWNFEVGNIEKNKTYSLYLNVDGHISTNLRYNNSSGSVIKAAYNLTGINVINFTPTEDGILFVNCFSADSGVYNSIPEIMLVEGTYNKDNVGEYEPYRSTTASLDLQDNFLAKIGDVKDELDVVTGKLTKRIGKSVLNGSENWSISSIDGLVRFASQEINGAINYPSRSIMLSNYFKYISSGNVIGGGFIYNQQFFAYPNQDIKTVADFKNWLSENNVEVYYVLAEPYEVQLTPSTIPMEEGKVNNYSVTNPLVENLYCKYYTQYRGDDGLTPVKGVDYFTEADKQELIASMPSGGGNIATIEPEEGENYIYFFPNVVNKGLVDGTYYLTHTLKLATDSVSNTSGVSNNTTLFTFDTLVEIKEYIDANDSSIKSYDFIALNGNTFFITTENGVITEVMQSTLITKAYVDNLFDSIVNGNEVSY